MANGIYYGMGGMLDPANHPNAHSDAAIVKEILIPSSLDALRMNIGYKGTVMRFSLLGEEHVGRFLAELKHSEDSELGHDTNIAGRVVQILGRSNTFVDDGSRVSIIVGPIYGIKPANQAQPLETRL